MTPIQVPLPARRKSSSPNAAQSPSGPHRGRPGHSSLWLVLAIAAAGVAGVGFYAYSGHPRTPTPTGAPATGGGPPSVMAPPEPPRAQVRPVSVAPDKAETRTPLVTLRVGQGGDAHAVVVLGRPEATRDIERLHCGRARAILERELIRQAILIAARDELGLSTRDELLDDAPPGKAEASAARDRHPVPPR